MTSGLWYVIACGALALLYGVYASRSVLSASPGNARMQEIAQAVQIGASAYLNRQYRTIAMVGVVVFALLTWLLGRYVGIGFLIGAICSGLAGRGRIRDISRKWPLRSVKLLTTGRRWADAGARRTISILSRPRTCRRLPSVKRRPYRARTAT